eukprot:2652648-Pleurochrysis_carterae.AAC.2
MSLTYPLTHLHGLVNARRRRIEHQKKTLRYNGTSIANTRVQQYIFGCLAGLCSLSVIRLLMYVGSLLPQPRPTCALRRDSDSQAVALPCPFKRILNASCSTVLHWNRIGDIAPPSCRSSSSYCPRGFRR